MDEKYYILNINWNGKNKVDYWIGEKRIAPIFYYKTTIEEISNNKNHELKKQAYTDAKRFINVFSPKKKENKAIIFSIGEKHIYIYKQKGPLKERMGSGEYEEQNIKFFKIRLLKKIEIKYCPLVLASIKSNRYMSTGTFRELANKELTRDSYKGNKKAIKYLITKKTIKTNNYAEYLQCLSSLEFETLIAKHLEEKGLFVPAYKGGFLKNYDLFCKNIGKKIIKIGETTIKPGGLLTIQVKLTITEKIDTKNLDLLFCITSKIKNEKIYDWEYLKNNINTNGPTDKWLKNTLSWVVLQKHEKK